MRALWISALALALSACCTAGNTITSIDLKLRELTSEPDLTALAPADDALIRAELLTQRIAICTLIIGQFGGRDSHESDLATYAAGGGTYGYGYFGGSGAPTVSGDVVTVTQPLFPYLEPHDLTATGTFSLATAQA